MAMSTRTHRCGQRHQPIAEINVTPLVDVMLVLLIVFMITAPLLAAGLRIDLPQAKAALPQNPKEPVVITIGRDGLILIGREPLPREALAAAVKAKLVGDIRAIHLRGDREVPYGDIVAVMDHLAANGLTRIALLANATAGRGGGSAGSQGVPPAPASGGRQR
jgi:biopolymer transport protein ExbD/biopolymer transport protein TolR